MAVLSALIIRNLRTLGEVIRSVSDEEQQRKDMLVEKGFSFVCFGCLVVTLRMDWVFEEGALYSIVWSDCDLLGSLRGSLQSDDAGNDLQRI